MKQQENISPKVVGIQYTLVVTDSVGLSNKVSAGAAMTLGYHVYA